jgi:hypothetical protein
MTAVDAAPAVAVELDAPPPPTKPRVQVAAALLALMIASSVAHLWALHRDLPLQDVDEHDLVRPAVQIAASGHPNPHWFGNPGSTVIYPLAGLFHVWDTVAHDGPLVGGNDELIERYRNSPTEFYVIARLWTISLAVGAVPFVYLIGRRAFNRRVALAASALWVVLPFPVHHGRLVRTDSAAIFFGLVSLWLLLRLLDDPRTRWRLLAGLSVGLAVASRYFMAALVPCLLAVAVLPHRQRPREALRAGGVALGGVLAAFALSTPYFFLDWDTARSNLSYMADPGFTGFSGERLGFFGNLRFYLESAIPDSLTSPLVALALAGVVLVVVRRQPKQVLLLAFCVVFLAPMCLSNLHWQRWILQILPLIVLFAAFALDAMVGWIRPRRLTRDPSVAGAILLVAVAVLAVTPVADLIEVERRDANLSTRGTARRWLENRAPPGSRVISSPRAFGVPESTIAPLENEVQADYDLDPKTRTVADYRRAGYRYAVVSANDQGNAFTGGRVGAFYLDLNCTSKLVARINASETRAGWAINIFDLTARPRRVRGLFCLQ